MEKVKVGFIGLGSRGLGTNGSGIISTVMACKEAQIVAVCDKEEDRVQQGIGYVKQIQGDVIDGYTNYLDVLKRDDVQAVVIATSWDEHIRMAIQAMKHGKITAMEVGGSYEIEECWELVRTYEETKVPIMMLENCCYDEFELLVTALARAGKFGEISHAHGAYRHDLRNEILGGKINRHYRLKNYIRRDAENYPTHELGPIAKIFDINRGNRFVSVCSMSSKAQGLEAFSYTDKNPDKSLTGQKFKQGDVVSTIIKCANGETITLTLNTCLPTYYSRELELHGTKGLCRQEENMIMLEDDVNLEEFWITTDFVKKHFNNAEKYSDYVHPLWKNITEQERKLGHGGMDYLTLKSFFEHVISGEPMPIDVYDAAAWMSITSLSENSIAQGGAVQTVPDFTSGKWVTRERLDVVEMPKVDK